MKLKKSLKKPYFEKLKDPRWQKKRLEILQRDDWKCQMCSDKEITLHVHHRDYLGDRNPWDYPPEFLVTLCEDCHASEKDIMNEQLIALAQDLKLNFFGEDLVSLCYAIHLMKYIDSAWRLMILDAFEWAMQTDNIYHLVEMYFEAKPRRREYAKTIPLMYILDKNGDIDTERFSKLNSMLEDKDVKKYFEDRYKESLRDRESQ